MFCVFAVNQTPLPSDIRSPGSNAGTVKASLAKLLSGTADLVVDSGGRPIDFGSVPLAPGEGDTTTTTPQMFASNGAGAGTSGAGGAGGSSGASVGMVVAGLSSDGHLTYEQLSGVLESLLVDKGYYSGGSGVGGGGSGGMVVVTEAELLDQLPLPNFNVTAHVGAHVAAVVQGGAEGGVGGGNVSGLPGRGGGYVGLPPLGRNR